MMIQEKELNHMVLNVIEDKTERDIVVKQIANLLNDKGVGVIATRTAQDPYALGFRRYVGEEDMSGAFGV